MNQSSNDRRHGRPATKGAGAGRNAAPGRDHGNQRRDRGKPSAPLQSARSLAYQCLLRIDHEGAYANILLAAELDRSRLDQRDKGFVTELVYGTTRMRRACDALVDRFVATDPGKELRTLLRLGAYQLVFAQVAPHAAVGETVELAPKSARGFVNAVLRRVANTPMNWPNDGVRLSYPEWIVQRLTAELGGDDAMATLATMNTAAEATERDDGYTQDMGSQLVAQAVGAGEGDTVLDVCAAPGGKATLIAKNGAFVVAADLQAARVGLIAANMQRLGATDMAPLVADGVQPPFAPGSFDRVLLDAPCSGLGTLRRRADARWRVTADDVDELAALQAQLLTQAAALVKPGGTLVYSVCTLLAAESTDHATPAGFEVAAEPPDGPWQPFNQGFRLLPHVADTDGMVIIRYRRLP
jgi:16S rRNA (cytosine967-C5)-methyltransferase